MIIKNTISILLYCLLFTFLNIICNADINDNAKMNGKNFGLNHTDVVFSNQHIEPYFDTNHNINVTALENETVILKCAVKFKENKTISWIRKSDLHILASENFVFSGDQRFTVLHEDNSNEWNLKIEYVTLNDSGYYECQLNTQPKIKLSVYLEVTVPEILQERMISSENSYDGKVKFARILGSSEMHVKIGSTISLTCIVNHQVSSIQWFHNSLAIEFNSNRGGINLETEKNADGTTSRLLLTRAQLRDNGNYSCVPHGAIPASSIVHVLNGEHPAAKYTSGTSSCFYHVITVPYITFLLLYYHCTMKKFVEFFTKIR